MVALESVRVRVVIGPEMVIVPIIVERVKYCGLLINGNLPHTYTFRQYVSFLFQNSL